MTVSMLQRFIRLSRLASTLAVGIVIAAQPIAAAHAQGDATLGGLPLTPDSVVYDLQIVATVEAEQTWEKNDPEYPGRQWSTATGTQRYEIFTQLATDGRADPRNLLDHDLNTRLEAKTIHLARSAVRLMEAAGKSVKIPETPEEERALTLQMQREMIACEAQPVCYQEIQMRYAAIFAAMNYPEALEEDTVPGQYLYMLPFRGCKGRSRVTLELSIEGVRYNKSADDFVPFSEHREADTVDAFEGLPLCDRFLAVIDLKDQERGFYLENVFVPRPTGTTTYTELGHTSKKTEPQPMPPAAVDWLTAVLRQAAPSGSAESVQPLYLSLNGNSTWLGLWKGEAKVKMEWRFAPADNNNAQPKTP